MRSIISSFASADWRKVTQTLSQDRLFSSHSLDWEIPDTEGVLPLESASSVVFPTSDLKNLICDFFIPLLVPSLNTHVSLLCISKMVCNRRCALQFVTLLPYIFDNIFKKIHAISYTFTRFRPRILHSGILHPNISKIFTHTWSIILLLIFFYHPYKFPFVSIARVLIFGAIWHISNTINLYISRCKLSYHLPQISNRPRITRRSVFVSSQIQTSEFVLFPFYRILFVYKLSSKERDHILVVILHQLTSVSL
jgi:hypothetical protein